MTGARPGHHRDSGCPDALGAASHDPKAWDQIDWRKAEQDVRRLQARIVKATREGRWGKVRALQHLLTHSFSGKAIAVRRVTTNRGKRTPGVDRETWTTSAQKSRAVHQLRQRGYRSQPLRRVYIAKPGKRSMRPLGIPTMADRAMQALYLLALSPTAETTGDECSYGFRPERSTADAINRCFKLLGMRRSPQWILEGDIRSCFDQVSHSWLLQHIPMERRILRQWLKAGFMDKSVIHPTEAGTPQGGIASPVLANMALDGLQRALEERFPRGKTPRGSTAHQVYLVRYADDFIVTGASEEVLKIEVKPLVERFLGERGLQLSTEKTAITHVDTGFDFLGMTIRKYRGKMLIKPSKKNVHSFLERVRRVVRTHPTATAGELVGTLTPMIRGWAYYHRHVVSSAIFASVDSEIWKALWRWALRRHPGKSRPWVKARYWPPHQGRQWVFTGNATDAKGQRREVRLFSAGSVKIRRHVAIKHAANPFDPAWDDYYRSRHARTSAPRTVIPGQVTPRSRTEPAVVLIHRPRQPVSVPRPAQPGR